MRRFYGRARFNSVPSFLYQQDLTVHTLSFGAVTVDIAFGSAFYAYLHGVQVGLAVTLEYRPLILLGDEMKKAVSAELEI